MITYFLKIAFRKFQSAWLLFTGSILTISIGALCISLLFAYVYNELSTNKFHKRTNDIYMMTCQISPESQLEPFAPSKNLKFNYREYPEIENLVSVAKYLRAQVKTTWTETSFSPQVLVADSSFFSIFDYKLLVGNKITILSNPGSAVITEDYARKIFGDRNPVGQQVKVITGETKFFTIKGIVKKVPSNSSIRFDMVLPYPKSHFNEGAGADFLLVNSKFNKEAFTSKIEHLGNTVFKGSKTSLMPLKDIYFFENPNFLFQVFFSRFGNERNVYALVVIMFIIFIVTALNFCGFQVVQINTGLKNIGVSKMMGIRGKYLFIQKTVEILLLILVSLLLVTIAYAEVLPYFNEFTKVTLTLSLWQILGLNLMVIATLFTLAMIYPAIITFKIPVTDSLKGKVLSSRFHVSQKAIVTIQYSLTIAAIIASMVIFRQVSFMLHKNMGFKSANVIRTSMYKGTHGGNEEDRKKREADKQKSFEYILNELATIPTITAFSQGDEPINPPSMMSWRLMGGEKDFTSVKGLFVQPDYLKVFGLQLVEGRFFDPQKDSPRDNKAVINEAAKRFWGIKDITKSRLQRWDKDSIGCEIIGVVKDFNHAHLSYKPEPLCLGYCQDVRVGFLIKFREGSVREGLQAVAGLFRKVNPGQEFTYNFISDDVAALHQKEKRLSQVYLIFTSIALIITMLGMLVLAAYDAQRRTKEIGIRKVNGARVTEILAMLNKDFVKWVAIAFVIACPIAYYAMHKWLQNFAYKTELSWWVFLVAGAVAVAVAVLTVSWQSWRAATRNPVESLRYE